MYDKDDEVKGTIEQNSGHLQEAYVNVMGSLSLFR
jgi:hypothetical protein